MRILGIDPGKTTGYAKFDTDSTNLDQGFSMFEIGSDFHTHETMYGILISQVPDTIVCEDFNYQRRDKVNLFPLELIGIVKLYSQQHSIPLVMQQPNIWRNFWSDPKLNQLGLYVPTKPHAMDALAHVLGYYSFSLKEQRFVNRLKARA
jgi:hypothetical protein